MTAAEPGVGGLPGPRTGIRELGHLAPDPAPHRGSLLHAELLRLRARRLVLVILVIGALGLAADVVAQWVNHEKPSAGAYAAATAQRDSTVQRWELDCRASAPADVVDQACAHVGEGFGVDQFLAHQPFVGARSIPDGVIAVAAGLTLLGFLVGATFIGAEWTSRNLAALLTWRPRRLQVMGTKALALVLGVAAVAAVALTLWLGAGALLMHSRGVALGTGGDFWRDTTVMALRAVVLAAFAGGLGFAIAMLVRNTGAALGVAFAYFAVGETLIRHLRPGWNPYLLISQFDAWLHNGGALVDTGSHFDRATGTYVTSVMHLSTPRAGLTLAIYVAVALVAAAVAFRRRDVA